MRFIFKDSILQMMFEIRFTLNTIHYLLKFKFHWGSLFPLNSTSNLNAPKASP